MDVPSSATGIVREIRVKLGDRLSKGTVVAIIEAAGAATAPAPVAATPSAPSTAAAPTTPPPAPAAATSETVSEPQMKASPTPARQCVPLAGNSAVDLHRSRHPAKRANSAEDVSVVNADANRQHYCAAERFARRRARPAAVAEDRFPPSSARLKSRRSRASKRFPARTSRATG